MLEKFKNLGDALDIKATELIDAIIKEEPTTKHYEDLLNSFNTTLITANNITQIIYNTVAKTNEEKQGE